MSGRHFSGHRARVSSLLVICLFTLLFSASCKKKRETIVPPPPTLSAPQIDPWKEAARRVEEDRQEPMGRKAQVEIPAELMHYSDRRRFLATQVADSNKHRYAVPHDYAELVRLIQQNELVEMEPLGDDYILYGVGARVTDEPFAHYDRATGKNVTLYADLADFEKEDEQLAQSINESQARAADLEKQLRQTPKRERTRRSILLAQIAETRRAIEATKKERDFLASFYQNPERRKLILAEDQLLRELAADFRGKTYNLDRAEDRRRFKVRLLSFIRSEARDTLLEIAQAYRKKFDRPLPITSLVRPEQYQRLLGETNRNATRIALPPHATGMAFDIYYYFMSAAEQDYLMAEIARLKSEGRVESLRENRDHIHVFVFATGERPDEDLIAQATKQIGGTLKPADTSLRRRDSKSKGAKYARSNKGKKPPQIASGRKKKGRSGARAGG